MAQTTPRNGECQPPDRSKREGGDEVPLRGRALRTEDAERLRHAGGLGQIPGTTVLVFIVVVASIPYYFVNRALLSFVREVG